MYFLLATLVIINLTTISGGAVAIRTIGGDKIKGYLNKAKAQKPMRLVYGYFPNATYPDGTFVASVANWNEFGTSRIPERPFFRNANKNLSHEVKAIAKKYRFINNGLLHAVGELAVANIYKSILGFGVTYAPNSPYTVSLKKSSKPLVDTGRLLNSATYKVTVL